MKHLNGHKHGGKRNPTSDRSLRAAKKWEALFNETIPAKTIEVTARTVSEAQLAARRKWHAHVATSEARTAARRKAPHPYYPTATAQPKQGRQRLVGLVGTGVKRTQKDLIDLLSKLPANGPDANVSRIYLGLTKGCLSPNRLRGHCAKGPTVFSPEAGQKILDDAAESAGFPGSTTYHSRGMWLGKPEAGLVFEALLPSSKDVGVAEFRSRMNAVAREAARAACQDSVMVVHTGPGGKALVSFVSHLGKRASQEHRKVC